MNAINFRTVPNNPRTAGTVIPVRVEAVLAAPVQDVRMISSTNQELRDGQQWAQAVNQLLSQVEPQIANAIALDEKPGDLQPNIPGSVAVSGQNYDVLADYVAGESAGSNTITHASVVSKQGKNVLEFSFNPNGTVTMNSETGYPRLSFTAHDGQIESASAQKQAHTLGNNRRADESYSKALHAEMMKPGWEDSQARQAWLHWG